ncbi:MAG: hypothetical protein ACREEP_08340, partial [Dongiaceae bacterium]
VLPAIEGYGFDFPPTKSAPALILARRMGFMDLSNFGKFPGLRDKTVFVTGAGSACQAMRGRA